MKDGNPLLVFYIISWIVALIWASDSGYFRDMKSLPAKAFGLWLLLFFAPFFVAYYILRSVYKYIFITLPDEMRKDDKDKK